MGFSYRKRINMGPLRINVSKSGVGVSAGPKGIRMGIDSKGRSYVRGGAKGLYYNSYGSNKNAKANNDSSSASKDNQGIETELLKEFSYNRTLIAAKMDLLSAVLVELTDTRNGLLPVMNSDNYPRQDLVLGKYIKMFLDASYMLTLFQEEMNRYGLVAKEFSNVVFHFPEKNSIVPKKDVDGALALLEHSETFLEKLEFLNEISLKMFNYFETINVATRNI